MRITRNNQHIKDADRNIPKALLEEWDKVCNEIKKQTAVKKPRK